MTKNFLLRFLSSLILGPLIILFIFLQDLFFYYILFIVSILTIYEIFKLKEKIIKISILFLLIIFVHSSLQIYSLDNGKFIIIYTLLLTWLSDIGGYVFGKFIGGKKIKIISPNKTYSGFLGSFLFVQSFGHCAKLFNSNYISEILLNFYFLLTCTLVVILGDMLFSYFKRRCNVKDFSNLIPGHGGLLDRIDGLIILTIYMYILKLWIL